VKKFMNDMKGAMTLFLVLLMTPFLAVALSLVEINRYSSAMTLFDEAIGVAANAALANYDEYLNDRFGLHAITQDLSPKPIYELYLGENTDTLGGLQVVPESTKAYGLYPLSEAQILDRQIQEYCKLNVPGLAAKFALEPLIEFFQEKIQKQFEKPLEVAGTILKTTEDAASGFSNALDYWQSLDKVKEQSKRIESLVYSYDSSYQSASSAAASYASALLEEDSDLPVVREAQQLWRSSRASVLSSAADSYRNITTRVLDEMKIYRDLTEGQDEALTQLATSLTSFAADYNEITSKKSKLESDLKSLDATSDDYAKKKSELETALSMANLELASAEGKKTFETEEYEALKDIMLSYSQATLDSKIDDLTIQNQKISYLRSSVYGSPSSFESGLSSDYHAQLNGFIPSMEIESLQDFKALEFAKSVGESSIGAYFEAAKTFFDASLLFEPEYSASIETAYFDSLPGSGLSDSGLLEVFTQLGGLFADFGRFQLGLQTMNYISSLKSVISIFGHIKDLILAIIQVITDLASIVAGLATDFGARLYFASYLTYNMPNRTDDDIMTGFELDLPSQASETKSFMMPEFTVLLGDLKALATDGSDKAFSGAELEYALWGSRSEIMNQAAVFLELLLFRVIFNVVPVFAQSTVESAALFTPMTQIVATLVESFVDTFLLVNGESVPVIKTQIYTSKAGLKLLLEKVSSAINIKDTLKKLETTLSDSVLPIEATPPGATPTPAPSSAGLLELDYRQHCLFLVLITTSKEMQRGRLMNIIQMEAENNYSTGFSLFDAHTFIFTETEAKFKSMLPDLAADALLPAKRVQVRGY
jgi:hypothetical protein